MTTTFVPQIDSRYLSTRFDAPHEDASGEAVWIRISRQGGIYLTRDEAKEYLKYGKYFENFLKDAA